MEFDIQEREKATLAINDLVAKLVAKAKANPLEYPIKFDHCFKRVAFDCAVGAVWDSVIPAEFYHHAAKHHIKNAIWHLQEMLEDPKRADHFNQVSLEYRKPGKRAPKIRFAHEKALAKMKLSDWSQGYPPYLKMCNPSGKSWTLVHPNIGAGVSNLNTATAKKLKGLLREVTDRTFTEDVNARYFGLRYHAHHWFYD